MSTIQNRIETFEKVFAGIDVTFGVVHTATPGVRGMVAMKQGATPDLDEVIVDEEWLRTADDVEFGVVLEHERAYRKARLDQLAADRDWGQPAGADLVAWLDSLATDGLSELDQDDLDDLDGRGWDIAVEADLNTDMTGVLRRGWDIAAEADLNADVTRILGR